MSDSRDWDADTARVEVLNNWNELLYSWRDQPLSFHREDIENDLPKNAEVVWPDGTREWLPIFGRSKSHPYSDMGHVYEYTQTTLYVYGDANGLEVEVPLTEVDIADVR